MPTALYSELPLIWTPEMRPPLYSDHFKMSQSMLPSTNPRVAGLEGVHCMLVDCIDWCG